MKLYDLFKKYPIVTIDSRECPENSFFFALKGENFDANKFALSALKAGASYAVIDNSEYAVDNRFIVVDDVLKTLQDLAAHHRKELGTKVIGITGTNGKTTSKELIASVLSEKLTTHFTKGNFNNHIGLPLTLLQLKESDEIAVIEMGANHPGEIEALAEIAHPNYGLITNVGKAHLEGFGSFEGVKQTKAELYRFIKKTDGELFINKDNKDLLGMAADSGLNALSKINEYGLGSKLDGKIATGIILDNSPYISMQCSTPEGTFIINTQLIGTYNAENILAAVAIGHYFGLKNRDIQRALQNYTPQNNRSQLVKTKNNTLIIDAYNANPSSMAVSIENFASLQQAPQKTLILGDMLELGEQSHEEHQKVIQLLKHHNFTNVFLVGSNFKAVKSKFCTFADIEEFLLYFDKKPITNQLILLKGSNGIGLTRCVEYL